MTHRTIAIIILTINIIVNTGCELGNKNFKVVQNDTTDIFSALIDSAFYKQYLPECKKLKSKKFGDTIIFKFDSILVGHLPANLKYKLLSEYEICSLVTLHNDEPNYFSNFLELESFERLDTIYNVSLVNHCLRPLTDEDEKKEFGFNCGYEKYCNGSISMTFIKQAAKLKPKIPQFASW